MAGLHHNQPVTSIGILGGTGNQGRGLALRLAKAGASIVIGSRDRQRAMQAAAEIGHNVSGADLAGAAQCDVVIVAVPWDAHESTLTALRSSLAGKIVIDCVNPIAFGEGGPVAMRVTEGSACQQAAALLPESKIVGAFHHIAAPLLLDESVASMDTDVLVVGDDIPACEQVVEIVNLIPGLRGVRAGKIADAGQVEALTVNLIRINRRLKVHAGIRVTGI